MTFLGTFLYPCTDRFDIGGSVFCQRVAIRDPGETQLPQNARTQREKMPGPVRRTPTTAPNSPNLTR